MLCTSFKDKYVMSYFLKQINELITVITKLNANSNLSQT